MPERRLCSDFRFLTFLALITIIARLIAESSDACGQGQQTISHDDAARGLTGVFPIRLDKYQQALQHSYNWLGVEDASMECELGFTPEAILVKGKILDDDPLFQTMVHPAMPEWWRIRYGADGAEFLIEDPTSASQRLQFVLNFSSAGTTPAIELLAAPNSALRGFISGAQLLLEDLSASAMDGGTSVPAPTSGFQFKAAMPTAGLVESRFFTGPLRITARLHDVDGTMDSYVMLQDVLDKKE